MLIRRKPNQRARWMTTTGLATTTRFSMQRPRRKKAILKPSINSNKRWRRSRQAMQPATRNITSAIQELRELGVLPCTDKVAASMATQEPSYIKPLKNAWRDLITGIRLKTTTPVPSDTLRMPKEQWNTREEHILSIPREQQRTWLIARDTPSECF